MEELRKLAFFTVAKGSAFGLFAIFLIMLGFSAVPTFSLRAGGFLALLMTMILLAKAWGAARADYRRTEMWLLLPRHHRPPEAHAKWAVTTVLHDAYITFAMRSAALAAALLGAALAVRLAGLR
ncbi:hypothetical protein [Blastochloris viridis]|uniref:Uncharacterized protein n=1 Tax=Blastochloris viridis TaxID=1079 RepID=A0A0H5BG50_BLAVI|nr:hypothetical protein [Blastochloris viridis]ALK10686.1 hypothetical protein BVIR_2923 [Blastochloris viridis]BAR99351.1 hypothetical protein BV133_1758 [Blastochloris viridis]CUU43349.1 hypothetical protein BVIRIDIS_23680 [Blastochloris viridis]